MLGLLKPTDPRWIEVAQSDLDSLLSDHAHCELKAAHSALSLVGRYGGEAPEIVEPLVALAKEETEHFDEVHRRIAERGARLEPPGSDAYVVALRDAARRDRGDRPAFLDRLLVSALIEARSCERFRLLAEHLGTMELRGFYRDLMASEARHYRLFAGMAETFFGRDEARARLGELAQREAEVLDARPPSATVHG